MRIRLLLENTTTLVGSISLADGSLYPLLDERIQLGYQRVFPLVVRYVGDDNRPRERVVSGGTAKPTPRIECFIEVPPDQLDDFRERPDWEAS